MSMLLQILGVGARASFEMFLAKYPPRVLAMSWIPRVIFQTLFFVLLVRFALGLDAVRFALIGNAVAMAAAVTLVQTSSILGEERQSGTMPYLIAVPANRVWIILGRSTAFYVDAVLSALLALVFVGTVTGNLPSFVDIAYALPLFLLICGTLSLFGLLVGSLAWRTRHTPTIANFVYYTMLVLCGVNYPQSVLPDLARVVGSFLPMTHGLEAMRAVLDGTSYAQVWQLLSYEAVLGFVYGVLAYSVFQTQIRHARKAGSIEFA